MFRGAASIRSTRCRNSASSSLSAIGPRGAARALTSTPRGRSPPSAETSWKCGRSIARSPSVRARSCRRTVFGAEAGKVGFVYEPCIHDPRNPTDRWSLSLHVSSPRDGERLDQEACLPALEEWRARRSMDDDDPCASVQRARYRHILIEQIARFVAGIDVPRRRGPAGTMQAARSQATWPKELHSRDSHHRRRAVYFSAAAMSTVASRSESRREADGPNS